MPDQTFITLASVARQNWLCAATEAVRERYEALGFDVPTKIRVSVGFPKGRKGRAGHAIGQCWKTVCSRDGHNEIFISPELGDDARICGVIAHELAHAIDNCEHGHKKEFKKIATAIGLTGKMTATTESPEFVHWVGENVTAVIGPYPAGPLTNPAAIAIPAPRKPRAKTLRFVCPDCDYEARVPEKCAEENGAPICPSCHDAMVMPAAKHGDHAGHCHAPARAAALKRSRRLLVTAEVTETVKQRRNRRTGRGWREAPELTHRAYQVARANDAAAVGDALAAKLAAEHSGPGFSAPKWSAAPLRTKRIKAHVATPRLDRSRKAIHRVNSRMAGDYAQWLAARDGIAIPAHGQRVIWKGDRPRAVTYDDVSILIPHWDWSPAPPIEETIPELEMAA